MKHFLQSSKEHKLFHPMRFLYAMAFAALFAVFGYFAPKIYLQYFDTFNYLYVKQPVPVDKEIYKPCDNLVTTLVRTSYIQDNGHSTVQIYLIKGMETTKRVPLYDQNIVIEKSKDKIYHVGYKLPCDLENGNYYIQAIITYHINGIQKTYLWITDAFTVNKNTPEAN